MIKKFSKFILLEENLINNQLKQFSEQNFEIKYKKIIDDFNPDNTYDVYWGANKESNHFLTTNFTGKYAKSIGGVGSSSHDIWLHASGYPGSHVLVKALKDDRVPENIIYKAALIAKKKSKAKDISNAPIVWTFRDYVSLEPSEEIKNRVQELLSKVDISDEEKIFIEKNQPGIGRAFIKDINRNIIYI